MKFVSIVTVVLFAVHNVSCAEQTNMTSGSRISIAPRPTPTTTATPKPQDFSPAVKRGQVKNNSSSSTGKQMRKSDQLKGSNKTLSVRLDSSSKKFEGTKLKPDASLQRMPHAIARNVSTKEGVRGKGIEVREVVGDYAGDAANNTKMAKITLESASSATLLKNGVKIIHLPDSIMTVTTMQEVRYGDVIAVVSQGGGPDHFGVALSVQINGTCYASGNDHFRVRQAFGDQAWTTPGFNACMWHYPVPVHRNPVSSSQQLLCGSCASKASFIWGKNSSPRAATFIRFVVGGETCGNGNSSSNASAKPTPSPSQQSEEKNPKIIDQNDDNDGKGRCKCRQLPDEGAGMCYMFTGAVGRVHGRWRRVCEKRQCFASFECVYDGSYSHWCMWKIARFQVQPIADEPVHAGRTFCRNARLPVPRLFLVPYSS